MTDVIAQLVRRFPHCFAKLPRERRLLQNGIEFAITALAPEIPEDEVVAALSDYTSHRSYLRRLVEGAVRVDLHGDLSGVVTAEEARQARRILEAQGQQPRAQALLNELSAIFPKAFFVWEGRRVPLKAGVHFDLHDLMPEIDEKLLSITLSKYTANRFYLMKCKVGATRVDLFGAEAGTVTPDEADHARDALAKQQAKFVAMKARKTDAPKPTLRRVA